MSNQSLRQTEQHTVYCGYGEALDESLTVVDVINSQERKMEV
jgi:hypothetical protein